MSSVTDTQMCYSVPVSQYNNNNNNRSFKMVKTSAQPNRHKQELMTGSSVHKYMYTYTIIYNEQPVTQDSNNTRFSTGK